MLPWSDHLTRMPNKENYPLLNILLETSKVSLGAVSIGNGISCMVAKKGHSSIQELGHWGRFFFIIFSVIAVSFMNSAPDSDK